MSTGEFDALLKRASHKQLPHNCWATTLDDRGRAFLDLVIEREAETPGALNMSEVRRILAEEFDTYSSREAVRRHVRGECRCER